MPHRGMSEIMPRDKYRRSRRLRLVPKQHIKYEGLRPMTITRYRRQINCFFEYLSDNDLDLPVDFDDLDETVGEFINHLYQDDYPINYGNDLLSGLKRFFPKCRRHLETSSTYMRSWNKTVGRRRALPLPSELLIAMAMLALLRNKRRTALALLVGFSALLRTGEVLSLCKSTMAVHGKGTLLSISLPDSKSGHRRGELEQVLIHDPLIIRLAENVLEDMAQNDNLLDMSYREFARTITELAACFGCTDPTLTPYCLRRGGATWHFTKYQCYDTTQELGRWTSAKTAKQYINQATSEIAGVHLPKWGKERMSRCNNHLTPFILSL